MNLEIDNPERGRKLTVLSDNALPVNSEKENPARGWKLIERFIGYSVFVIRK